MIYLRKPPPMSDPLSSTITTVKDFSEALTEWIDAMHPHTNCSVCHGIESGKLEENAQLEALIPSMRQDAQGTLASLQRKGYEIRKKSD